MPVFGSSARHTIATSHWPASIAMQARCSAVSDEEHWVSTARLGPSKLQTYDTRLAMLAWLPDRMMPCAPKRRTKASSTSQGWISQ